MDVDGLIAVTTGFLLLFWAMLGAAIGSFLNVVVYRLPRGLNLSHPPSSCPACRRRIRWHDNVPVLGWLWLGGRCRDCHLPISPRYPFVEGLVGLIFLALAAGQLVPGGANLPRWPKEPGIASLHLPSGPLLALTALHGIVFSVLVAAALIDQDGLPVPWLLFLPGVLLVPLTEWLHPVNAPLGLAVGAVLGGMVGCLYDPGTRSHVRAMSLGLALLGGILGGMGAVLAASAAVMVWLVVFVAAPEFAFRLRWSPLTPAIGMALAVLLLGKSLRIWS